MRKEIVAFLKEKMQETGVEVRDIEPDEPIFSSGLLDSFVLVDMVTFLEKKFGVLVPDEDLKVSNFDTLNLIKAYITENME